MNDIVSLPKQGKSILAYTIIKNMIIDGELQSGEIISENKLSVKLNMSRTPVREAVQALFNEGYVEIHKGIGILIKHVTLREMHDVNSVRVLLETFAIRNNIDSMQTEQFAKIRGDWIALRERIRSGAMNYADEMLTLDHKTHRLFYDYSGNQVLRQINSSLETRVLRYQKMLASITADDVSTATQHIEILDAIRAKDVDGACKLLETHIFKPLYAMYNKSKENIY